MVQHFSIDMERTGARLKDLIKSAGYDVKYIQKYLRLACPQPVYRWFNGKVMPSLEHLYALSVLLEVHMEELIVVKNKVISYELYECNEVERIERVKRYYRYILKAV